MRSLLVGLLGLLPLWPAQAAELRDRQPTQFLVVHDIRRPVDREAVHQRIAEHVRDDFEVQWIHLDEYGSLWTSDRAFLDGTERDSCSASVADAKHVMQLGERAFGLLGLGRRREAQRKAAAAEARWPCLHEYVPTTTLQRSALAEAWAAHQRGDQRSMRQRLDQAAAMSLSLPHYATEELPTEVQTAFVDAVERTRLATRSRLVVTAKGAPVEVYVDGKLLSTRMGSGGIEAAEVELLPGRHLVQFAGSGPHTESVAFRIGSSGGEVQLEKISRVKTNEVLQVFERSLARGDVVPLLGGLIRAHPASSSARRVVLARADRRFQQTQLRLLPANRTPEGSFETDDQLYSALEVTLDEESEPASEGAYRDTRPNRPGRWRLRTGLAGGVAFIHGFVYGSAAVDLSLESPVLIGLDIRPEGALAEDSDRVFAVGGGSAHLVFCPRIKRIRFDAGVGFLMRAPDHRFDGLRAHPSIELGVGVRPVGNLWLLLRGQMTLRTVYDGALHLSVAYEFDLQP